MHDANRLDGMIPVVGKALAASKVATLPVSYWAWDEMLAANERGFFPYTPATNLLYGLREAIAMLMEEGLENVFARHARHGEATRRAIETWGLETVCRDAREHSNSLTAVMMPDGVDADAFRKVVLDAFGMSLGNGLSRMQGKVFRVGHLGDFNDLMLMGTLAGLEMGFELASVPHAKGGVQVAMDYLCGGDSAEGAVRAAG